MITIQSVIKIVGDRIVEGVKRENKITPTNLQYLDIPFKRYVFVNQPSVT